MTLLGTVELTRPYYRCPAGCGGHSPRDAALRLSADRLTAGATRAVALAGATGSFAEAAAKTLPELCGLRLGESTVGRATERAGAEVGRRLAAGETFGPAKAWGWPEDSDGETVGYVSADLTGVGMQGAGGAKADGRTAAAGMVWNPGKPGQVRYACGVTGGLAASGDPLRRQAAQVGMDAARRWVATSDGGAGVEDWLRVHFPRVEAVVLDFWHAAQRLSAWAKALHPADEAEAGRVAGGGCHRSKREGGEAVLAALRAMAVGRRPAAKEAHRKPVGSVENQAHRMDYPAYRAKGWAIGSGPVEAACKQVVNQRLKVTGARWSEPGADAVCHLRALFRSELGQWDAYWAATAA